MKKIHSLAPQLLVAWMLTVSVALLGLKNDAAAMLAPAVAPGSEQSPQRAADLARIQRVLENKRVSQKLKDLGLSESEVQDRLSKLSDREVHQLATKMQALTPAGDSGLGLVIALLVIGVLALLIVYLAKRV